MSNPARRRNRIGFSLVELLVVIGIMAGLLAILLPALNGARNSAASAACMSNARQIVQGALNYAVDHNNTWVGYDPDEGIDRKELLNPYLGKGESNADVDGTQVWHCPRNEFRETSAGYGFNTNLNFERVPRIARPAQTVGVVDAGIDDDGDYILATHAFPPSQPNADFVGRPNPRHGSDTDPTVSVAFADGSAESHTMTRPFYVPSGDPQLGNGVTDKSDPDYLDELWDVR